MNATSKQQHVGPHADWPRDIRVDIRAKGWRGGYSGYVNNATRADYEEIRTRLSAVVKEFMDRTPSDDDDENEDESSWQHGHLPEDVEQQG